MRRPVIPSNRRMLWPWLLAVVMACAPKASPKNAAIPAGPEVEAAEEVPAEMTFAWPPVVAVMEQRKQDDLVDTTST